MTKSEAVYSKYEGFEEQLAHCYFLLQERFIADPQLARFWANVALDELQHFSMLRFCRERGLMSDVLPEDITTRNIELLLETVKGLATDPEISIEEAFYASLLIESSEMDDVYQSLTGRLEVEHPFMYRAIHAALRGHHQNFSEGAEKFCKDPGFAEAFRNLGRSIS
jgi:hypothetical protein